MNSPTLSKITLAIESAVEGGSLSLQQDGVEIDNWLGDSNVSRAEDLLWNISELLKLNGVEKRQITLLAVATGPGSYTGIRIGLATALGLKNALGVTCRGVPTLEAMSHSSNKSGRILAAVPMGREAICFQPFESTDIGIIRTVSEPAVSKTPVEEIVAAGDYDQILLHDTVFRGIKNQTILDVHSELLRNVGRNLANLIGTAAGRMPVTDGHLQPLFVDPHK